MHFPLNQDPNFVILRDFITFMYSSGVETGNCRTSSTQIVAKTVTPQTKKLSKANTIPVLLKGIIAQTTDPPVSAIYGFAFVLFLGRVCDFQKNRARLHKRFFNYSSQLLSPIQG